MRLGDPSKYVHHVMDIEPVGRVSPFVGRGICLIIGTADRGPGMRPIGFATESEVSMTFGSGKLVDQAKLALREGCNMLYLIRVMGNGYSKAYVDATAVSSGSTAVGRFWATSDGNWGNSLSLKIEKGDLKATDTETFAGDGTVGPYHLKYDDYLESPYNMVTVGGVSKTIVYSQEGHGQGKVYLDKQNGTLTFYTGEEPKTTDQIKAILKYTTRKVSLYYGGLHIATYNNIDTVMEMEARMGYSPYVRYVGVVGETRLPKYGVTLELTGGADGSPITYGDWELAFEQALNLPPGVYPNTCCITQHEVEEGSYDLVARLSGYANEMADRFRPCQCFVAIPYLSATEGGYDIDAATQLGMSYNNPWLTIGANYYNANGDLIVGAVAGKQASLQLGSSIAEPINALSSAGGLLWQFNDSHRELLNKCGLDVLVKDQGIASVSGVAEVGQGVRPYVGISTNKDTSHASDVFKLLVDMATISHCIQQLDITVSAFYHAKRTWTNLKRVQASMELWLAGLAEKSVLDDYKIAVTPNPLDRNAAKIQMWIQPVGHILRWETTMYVGHWSDKVAE